MKFGIAFLFFFILNYTAHSQVADTVPLPNYYDTVLRIKNLDPYITLHSDSVLNFQPEINKPANHYYWFLKNQPVGLKIDKQTGLIRFKADKSYFLSGKLKYDYEYKVLISVQNLDNPADRFDTSFILLFFNTEIIPSRLKATVAKVFTAEEGDTVRFAILCENGSFPIEQIQYFSNYALVSATPVTKCADEFTWFIPYGFVKPEDREKSRTVSLTFIGNTRFQSSDTTEITILVKQSINFPLLVSEHMELQTEIQKYINDLKSSFRQVDKKIRKTKRSRTTFDLASASTALGGTIFSSLPNSSDKATGKILPSVGVALVPVKEAVAPNASYEQNTATLIRSAIKRLDYQLIENRLISDKDPDIVTKNKRLKDELNQAKIQLIDIPMPEENLNSEELDEYFNSPKVKKRYKIHKK